MTGTAIAQLGEIFAAGNESRVDALGKRRGIRRVEEVALAGPQIGPMCDAREQYDRQEQDRES
jgi:hypothetical protein